MVTKRTDIRLATYDQVYWSFDIYRLATIIKVLLYCCDKLANFGMNLHKPELYLLSFGSFLFSIEIEI